MIKNIIFDWSGVISDNLMAFYNTVMIVFEKYGAERISLEELKKKWELPYMVFYNKYMPELSKEDQDNTYKAGYKISSAKYPPRIYSHIEDTLQKFKNAGINMIVVSSDNQENFLPEIEEFDLRGLFTEVNCGVHDKSEEIHGIIKRNKFNIEETIFIGDTTQEIDAGRSAGTKTGAVTWGVHSEDKLKSANPDYIIHNLKEMETIVL